MPARLNEQHRSARGEARLRRSGPPFPDVLALGFAISFRHTLMWIVDDEQIHSAASHRASDASSEYASAAGGQLPFILLTRTEFNGEP